MTTKLSSEITIDDLEAMGGKEACRWALMKAAGVLYEDVGQETIEVYRKRSSVMAQWVGYALGALHREGVPSPLKQFASRLPFDSAGGRKCPTCAKTILRRPDDSDRAFRVRVYCDRKCFMNRHKT